MDRTKHTYGHKRHIHIPNRWTDQTDCQIKLDRLTEQTRLTHEQIMLKPSVRLAEGMISHMYRPDSNIIVSLFNNV